MKLFFEKQHIFPSIIIYYHGVAQILPFSEILLEKVKKYAIVVYC